MFYPNGSWKFKRDNKNMNNPLVFCTITLALASVSLGDDNILLFSDDKNKLQLQYGNSFGEKKPPSNSLKMTFYDSCINSSVCTKKPENNQHQLRYFSETAKQECVDYERIADSMNEVLQFCVDMENTFWYGGAERTEQRWPLNKLEWTDNSYVTKESESQAVVESYFFNSEGYYIHIDDSVALFVDINGPRPGQMCFAAKVTGPYKKTRNAMRFRTCKYGDPREAHENAVRDVLGRPNSIPDPYVVKYPIWSTWARYKVNVNTSNVNGYAQEIVHHGFPRGTLEIDDNWETCYGSAKFNTSRFGNVRELVRDLKSIGFKTSLWIHPFINLNCDTHDFAHSKGYLVNSTRNTVNSNWWNGNASYIDFTNPEAAAWWSNNIRDLLAKSGIDTLKFDAGESSWNPQLPVFYDKDLTYYPDNIVNAYLETISAFGNGIEYRSSRRSQKLGRFLRMIDRESRWDYRLGLPTLITSLLQLNMIGYPFVLPDMIGGNGYNNTPPSKEMYIRWMQANTFMLVMQFSYTPWDFDQQTIDICRRLMDLRSNYTDTMIELMRKSVSKGNPINPPVWWIDPTDSQAHAIDDEYLLGENILVAPVLIQNARYRDIYLPGGLWRDENHPNSSLIPGRTWILEYPAGLDVLPWFTKVGELPNPQSSNTINLGSSKSLILVLTLIAYLFR